MYGCWPAMGVVSFVFLILFAMDSGELLLYCDDELRFRSIGSLFNTDDIGYVEVALSDSRNWSVLADLAKTNE